tara:strand:+ start:1117 stop:3303 length:2187 start_codon:yes stop_codon:yes gene_type:complete
MTISIQNNDPRISYSVASGVTQGSFTIPFDFYSDSDVNVYVDDVLKVITADYTVSGGSGSTGTLTMSVTGASGTGSTVVILRNIPLDRTTNFPLSGPFNISSLNTELDRFVAITADQRDNQNQSITVPDAESYNMVLPKAADRAGKLVIFDEVGNVEVASEAAIGNIIVGANFITDAFTGDGSTVAFTLSVAANSKNNTQVHVDGVYQNKTGYSLNGAVLTFSEAPPLNAAIEVVSGDSIAEGSTANSSAVDYNQGGTGAVDRTVKAKLQEFISVKDFGAVGDGVTDDSAAIQAAISAATYGVHFPQGVYVAAEIPLNKNDFVIYGPMASIKNNLAGLKHTFVVRDGINFRRSKVIFNQVTNQGTAGHIFSIENGGLSGCTIDITELAQNTVGYKILTNEVGGTVVGANIENENAGLFFTDIKGGQWSCSSSNTADNLIDWCSNLNTCSVNTFEITDIRPLGSGRFAKFHSTSASGASYNQIKIKDSGVEKSNNGFVSFRGCSNSGVENVVFYDMDVAHPTIDSSLILFQDGAGGTESEGGYATYVQRNGGVLNTGVYDIDCQSTQIYLERIGSRISGDGFKVNLNSNRVLVQGYQFVTFDGYDNRYATIIDKSAGILTPYINPQKLVIGDRSEKTIVAGVVTATGSFHEIDTQGDAASDDLDTINGGENGMTLIIVAANSARTVVAKDSTGNLRLNGDFSLDHQNDTLTLIYNGSNWLEVSRSDNQT